TDASGSALSVLAAFAASLQPEAIVVRSRAIRASPAITGCLQADDISVPRLPCLFAAFAAPFAAKSPQSTDRGVFCAIVLIRFIPKGTHLAREIRNRGAHVAPCLVGFVNSISPTYFKPQ